MTVRSRSLAAVVLAAGLAACASDTRERQQFVEQPVEQIYNDAARLLEQRRWTEAASAFEEVERQHPYSSWARRSMLMTTFARYQANQYDEAIDAARRFIALHPGNESAPYAYYMIAISNFERILDVGRDQKMTEDALQALQDVVRRYPDTDYARDARLKIDMTYDQLAGKEMSIGRYYLRNGQHLAAINRFRTVIETPQFQTTTHTPEALHRLVEAYVTVGLTEEAQRTAAVLGYNFPGSDWYARTYELMTGQGVSMISSEEAERRGWLSRLWPFGDRS